jgi:hypothetical protein
MLNPGRGDGSDPKTSYKPVLGRRAPGTGDAHAGGTLRGRHLYLPYRR